MPGSMTTRDRPDACDSASGRIAFRTTYGVGVPSYYSFAAQWLAYTLPCRRFTVVLAKDGVRLGADVDRYSFIAADSHRLLRAGLPAHKW